MRPGQNRRVRGRTNRKGPNPLTRSYESNGPDVKIRGTAQHIAEKYTQLARDAQVAGDPVASESLLQHAEHYFRLIAAAQAQYQQTYGVLPRSFEDGEDGDGDDDFGQDSPVHGRIPQGMHPGMDQSNVADDAYPVGIPQPGNAPQGGYRDRPERQDRQDRAERPERFERPQRNERYDRQDRPERHDRSERQSRPEQGRAENERSEQRQDVRQEPRYEPRQDARQDSRAEPRQNSRQERAPRAEPQPRASADSAEFRPEGEREPRGGRRERFRRDRDVRPVSRDEVVAGDDVDQSGGLPAFLTTPLRPAAPAAVEPAVEALAPAPAAAPAPAMPDHGSTEVEARDVEAREVEAREEIAGEEGGERFPVRARRRRGRPRADEATDPADTEQSAAG